LDVDTTAVATSGIVTVTVDFKLAKDLLAPTPANGLCQPRTFCKANGDACVGALTSNAPLVKADPGLQAKANAVCGQWAVKDLDCPAKGCLGVQFTLPSSAIFQADATIDNPSPHRPHRSRSRQRRILSTCRIGPPSS